MNKKQVKTKKVVKRRLNIKRVFLLVVIVYLLFTLAQELLKVDISNVTVTGNNYVSDSVIIKLAHLNEDVAYLRINTKEACDNIKKISLIDSCKIKRGLNWKLEIQVTENSPVFFYSNNNRLVLSNGEMIEEANTYAVPILINYVPENVLKKFIDGLKSIKSDIIRSISEIEYTPSVNNDGTYIDEERFMLSMNDGNIVYVNIRNLSILGIYDKIYASIGDKKGYYNFDCDFDNYIFKEFESQ